MLATQATAQVTFHENDGFRGAAVGSQVGGDGHRSRDVRRCENIPSQARPEFWDVGYTFRGQAHHVQLTSPPGRTITVNGAGEPRE